MKEGKEGKSENVGQKEEAESLGPIKSKISFCPTEGAKRGKRNFEG